MAIGYFLVFRMFAVEQTDSMRPEEVIVLRVLRFVVVASLAAALIYMVYNT